MKAMLLAAGRGRRMGELTDACPKPLLEVGGRPLIERNLLALADAGIRDVVINLSYLGAQIENALGDGRRLGVSIEYSREPEPPLETAGGIVQALPRLGNGPFMLLNADVLTNFPLATLADRRQTLVMVPNPPHNPDGDFFVGADGVVVPAASGEKLTFSGLSVLDTTMFDGLAPGPRSLKSVLDVAIANGALRALVHRGLWLDVGTPGRLAEARERLALDGTGTADYSRDGGAK